MIFGVIGHEARTWFPLYQHVRTPPSSLYRTLQQKQSCLIVDCYFIRNRTEHFPNPATTISKSQASWDYWTGILHVHKYSRKSVYQQSYTTSTLTPRGTCGCTLYLMDSVNPADYHRSFSYIHYSTSFKMSSAPSNENSLPIHSSSTTTSTSRSTTSSSLKDGRKNSGGEELASPVESWKPNLNRQQSWNQQDMKRQAQLSSLESEEKGKGGFSEVETAAK